MEGGTDHDLRVLDTQTNDTTETKTKPEASASDDGAVAETSTGKLFSTDVF